MHTVNAARDSVCVSLFVCVCVCIKCNCAQCRAHLDTRFISIVSKKKIPNKTNKNKMYGEKMAAQILETKSLHCWYQATDKLSMRDSSRFKPIQVNRNWKRYIVSIDIDRTHLHVQFAVVVEFYDFLFF